MTSTCKSNTKSNSKEKKVIKKAEVTQKPKGGNGSKSKKISFSYFDPEAHQVSLAGDFNNWAQDGCFLKRKDTGEWNATLDLKPGIYDYRFIVDGEWREDPGCNEKIPNPFGTFNNRIIIK